MFVRSPGLSYIELQPVTVCMRSDLHTVMLPASVGKDVIIKITLTPGWLIDVHVLILLTFLRCEVWCRKMRNKEIELMKILGSSNTCARVTIENLNLYTRKNIHNCNIFNDGSIPLSTNNRVT